MLRFKQFLVEGLDKNIVWQTLNYEQRKNTSFFEKLLRDRMAFPNTLFNNDREKSILNKLTTSINAHSNFSEMDKLEKTDYLDNIDSAIKDYNKEGTPKIGIHHIEDSMADMRASIDNIKTLDSKVSQVSEKPMRVYRSITFNPDLPDEHLDERGIQMKNALKRGGIARNSGFLSTSPNKKFVSAFNNSRFNTSSPIIFEIDVPAGTKFLTNPLSTAGKVPEGWEKFTPNSQNNLGIGENEIIFGREL